MGISNVVENDRFAQHVGIKLLDVSKGSARAEMEIKARHLNGLGMVHGGAIFTLADLAFAAAANSHDVDALAINISITYFKATRKGKLFAEARELSLNRKLGTYLIEITDDVGDRIASFQGTAYRKTPKKNCS